MYLCAYILYSYSCSQSNWDSHWGIMRRLLIYNIKRWKKWRNNYQKLFQNPKVHSCPEHQSRLTLQVTHVRSSYSTLIVVVEKKVAGGTIKVHKDRSRSPSPHKIGSTSNFPPLGRWTAHRAYIKKVYHYIAIVCGLW